MPQVSQDPKMNIPVSDAQLQGFARVVGHCEWSQIKTVEGVVLSVTNKLHAAAELRIFEPMPCPSAEEHRAIVFARPRFGASRVITVLVRDENAAYVLGLLPSRLNSPLEFSDAHATVHHEAFTGVPIRMDQSGVAAAAAAQIFQTHGSLGLIREKAGPPALPQSEERAAKQRIVNALEITGGLGSANQGLLDWQPYLGFGSGGSRPWRHLP